MMAGALLWRGMLAGLIAAFLSALLALALAEPRIDDAIAFEHAHVAATHHTAGHGDAPAEAEEEELVSRATQKGAGLFTAMMLYGAAVGGLFSLAFAAFYGRVGGRAGPIGPRTLAIVLALAAFVLIVLVPTIKYPTTPPAVGLHETVRVRTAAFFAMIALSLLSAWGAGLLWQQLRNRLVGLDRLCVALGGYLIAIVILQRLLPVVDEVPASFPATLLWQFRLASLGSQLLLWVALGLLFGRLAEGVLRRR